MRQDLGSGIYSNEPGTSLLRTATSAAASAAAAAAAQQPQLTRQATANMARGVALLEAHDVVLWAGDLNYRIQGNSGAVLKAIEQKLIEVLHVNDQLSIQRKQVREGNRYVSEWLLCQRVGAVTVCVICISWQSKSNYMFRGLFSACVFHPQHLGSCTRVVP